MLGMDELSEHITVHQEREHFYHAVESLNAAIKRLGDRMEFVICDNTSGAIFEGFVTDDGWKEWECPAFDSEAVEAIRAYYRQVFGIDAISYDADTDTYYTLDPDLAVESAAKGFDHVDACGQTHHVYQIGAGTWQWSLA